jgi:hypothetical protein
LSPISSVSAETTYAGAIRSSLQWFWVWMMWDDVTGGQSVLVPNGNDLSLSFQVVRESSSQPHCPLLQRSRSVHHWGLGGRSLTWNFNFFSLLYAPL